MFTKKEYIKYYASSSTKHLSQYHLMYFSLKGFSGISSHISNDKQTVLG